MSVSYISIQKVSTVLLHLHVTLAGRLNCVYIQHPVKVNVLSNSSFNALHMFFEQTLKYISALAISTKNHLDE